ncbi:MAG: DPP IV N-terminal domain-containing protein [Candidatus Eisenbacteria bacterium]|uniref:DPP IV N-terminal domain-containing protein n=1 Tax=Eiseniibacteriota bacterium TaxID=2212470 RepID=A0A948RV37_UNCEI|nr:DPP IV N-terminal domain-containing protein [Candidatus Eisenbacteria bacterium]MBU2691565.1 DPP IV N-terminal domain-containing protein [Candidatus Eisenbacteria bacterium]
MKRRAVEKLRRYGILVLGCLMGLGLTSTPTRPEGTVIQLTSDPADERDPAWSPDGSRIAFSRDSASVYNSGLWIISPTGGAATKIVPATGIARSPSWSSGGDQIAFSRNNTIRRVAATGGATVQLTTSPSSSQADTWPAWSPILNEIIYTTGDGAWLNYQMYKVLGSGGDEMQISVGVDAAGEPSWDPDGSRIAFRGRAMVSGEWATNIYITAFSGGSARRLTNGREMDRCPAWSPNGDKIAFSSFRSGNWDIWIIPVVGGAPTQLTTHGADDLCPTWSPDGTQIAFQSDRGGNYDIWLTDAIVPVQQRTWGRIKKAHGE